FPDPALNRDLYLWLVALASRGQPAGDAEWFAANQRLVGETLTALPGLAPVYRRLVEALLALRADPEQLPAAEGRRERAIRDALRVPGCRDQLPVAPGEPKPVPLWLYPCPELAAPESKVHEDMQDKAPGTPAHKAKLRRRGEYVEDIDGRNGLIVFRLE